MTSEAACIISLSKERKLQRTSVWGRNPLSVFLKRKTRKEAPDARLCRQNGQQRPLRSPPRFRHRTCPSKNALRTFEVKKRGEDERREKEKVENLG